MGEPTSRKTVARYLTVNYVLTDDAARGLVEKHLDVVEHAMVMGSYSYYPAERIAVAEQLEEREDENPPVSP